MLKPQELKVDWEVYLKQKFRESFVVLLADNPELRELLYDIVVNEMPAREAILKSYETNTKTIC